MLLSVAFNHMPVQSFLGSIGFIGNVRMSVDTNLNFQPSWTSVTAIAKSMQKSVTQLEK